MTKALAKELAPSGITVNAIAPGVIDTDMNKNISPEDMEALLSEIPLGRMASPREVAETALFLAGERASYITGEVINVSGGFYI
jgi:3-oxoacyl-[acyl-carrier protein] reductase